MRYAHILKNGEAVHYLNSKLYTLNSDKGGVNV